MSNHAGKLIVRILEKSGVKNVWGITGDSANFITEALFESPINFMHVRHEEAAGMACGAEAEVSGGLGVCIGSCGPGALHLINGLYEANKEHNPVLCLATHIPSGEIGTNYVQETDVFNLFTDCSVFCQYVQSVEQLPRIMGIAMQTAVSRKGVSVLLIPGDISSAVVKGDLNLKYTPHYTEEVITPCPESVRELADSINRSERVAIIAGKNAGVAAKEVTELANLLQAPVGFDLQGKATFESLVKNRLGCFDKHCKDYPVEMLSKADLILLTGVENPYMSGIPPKARVAYIDGFVDNIIKSHNTDHTIYGAPDETLRLLIPLLDSKTDSGYASDCESYYSEFRARTEETEDSITYRRLMRSLDARIPQDAQIVADTGPIAENVGRYLKGSGTRKFHYSHSYQSPGATLPLAMGVRKGCSDEQAVIALCRYDGIQRFMGELLTLRQLGLNLKVAVINESINTKPDLSRLAGALGLESNRLSNPDDLEEGLKKWLESDTCGCIQIDVLPNQ